MFFLKKDFYLAELEFRLPPVIVYGPQNQTLPVGDTATMLCQASGDPEPEIMWWKNNELLLPNEPLILTRENGILEINSSLASLKHFSFLDRMLLFSFGDF